VDAPKLLHGKAVTAEQPHDAVLRINAIVRKLAVVVEPEEARNPLCVGVAVRQVRDVERAAERKDTADLLEARVRIVDVLEHAARQDGVEAPRWEGKDDRVRTEVDLDPRKPFEWRDHGGVEAFAVIERNYVGTLLSQEGCYLAEPTAPVEDATRVAACEAARERSVLEHLRPRAEMNFGSTHGRGWYETAVIDAVVATRDSREMVLECVEQLRSPRLGRVIVVDNGSVDGTAEALQEAHPDAAIVRVGRPEGLSYAYNRGAEEGTGDLILFLNDDVLATDEGIAELERALELRPEAVAAAGRLVEPGDGSTQLEYQPRPFPTLTSFVATFAGLEALWPRNPITGKHRRRPLDEKTTVPVDYAPGACLLVRRAAFERVGGWDERFEFWFEDVDLERRLSMQGPVFYVPTAPFAHVGGHSARRLSRAQLVSRHYRGALVYGEKHFGRARRIGLGLLFGLVGGARVLTSRGDPAQADAYRSVVRSAMGLLR
jgi:N-acetylglucosaminyl-diphospho-decaprenol L-rhamnosyltransferase